MGYISVVCTNPDCALETTRTEDTEYCPRCDAYTQPIAGLTSQAAPVAPMINNDISIEELRSIAEAKPLEFDGSELALIRTLLEEKQYAALDQIVQLESENINASNTKEYVHLCNLFDKCMRMLEKISKEFESNRAKTEVTRRLTGFYSKAENIKSSNVVSVA